MLSPYDAKFTSVAHCVLARERSARTFIACDSIGQMSRTSWMSRSVSVTVLFLSSLFGSAPVHARMQFYTDDTSVTAPNTLHVEIFDEFDGLQSSQFPDERREHANVTVNF